MTKIWTYEEAYADADNPEDRTLDTVASHTRRAWTTQEAAKAAAEARLREYRAMDDAGEEIAIGEPEWTPGPREALTWRVGDMAVTVFPVDVLDG